MSMIFNPRRLGIAVATAFSLATLIATPSFAAAKVQRLVTPGGIEAWFVRDATVPVIAMEYAFGGGAAQDPKDKSGTANMVASLMDEGAGDLDSAAFRERMERRAIELNFTAQRDYLRGSLRMLKDHRDEAFELAHLAVTSPRFDAPDVERIRAQIMSGLRRESTNPNALATRKFLEMAFGDHPYSRQSNGSLTEVPKIGVDDIRAYKQRIVARDTLKVAVVGDIDPDSLARLLDKLADNWG